MDFVDKQDIPRLKICQDCGEVTGAGDHRTGGRAESDAEFAGDDLRQGGFAETGRAVEEDMVQGFAAIAGRLDEDG